MDTYDCPPTDTFPTINEVTYPHGHPAFAGADPLPKSTDSNMSKGGGGGGLQGEGRDTSQAQCVRVGHQAFSVGSMTAIQTRSCMAFGSHLGGLGGLGGGLAAYGGNGDGGGRGGGDFGRVGGNGGPGGGGVVT